MPRSPKTTVIVKKVKPYPIKTYMEGNAQKLRCEIVLLTLQGFLVRLKQELLHVGDYYRAEFTIPVVGPDVVAKVRVIKTYDRAGAGKDTRSIERFAEFHFDDLAEHEKSAINRFLVTIGQK